MNTIIFIDTEVNPENQNVLDYGAFVDDNRYIHTEAAGRLDDKLQADELNNPLNDCKKAMELFYGEVNAFRNMHPLQREIYASLLCRREEFRGFFSYVGFTPDLHKNTAESIRSLYRHNICGNCDLEGLITRFPVELAYVLAVISAQDTTSMTPGWVIRNFPNVSYVIKKLCNTLCYQKCPYCQDKLDIHKRLKQIFGYDDFRKFEGENLQERAVQAAVDHKSVIHQQSFNNF